jgi:AcrR family transcriptional regulator
MKRNVKKASERRGEIINVARKFFQTNENEKVTMQELMDTINIEKSTIYRYFSSKEEVLEVVVEDLLNEKLRKKAETMSTFSTCFITL